MSRIRGEKPIFEILVRVIPLGAVVLSVYAVFYLYSAVEPPVLSARLPGADKSPAKTPTDSLEKIVGELEIFAGEPATIEGAWPQFRGPDRNAIAHDPEVRLLEQWPASGPELIWQIDVGEGYAGAAILNGMVYLIDYDRVEQRDVIRCLSLADGRDIWQYSYPVTVKRNHGMSRTIPAVTDEFIVTIGPKCHVTCLDSRSGEFHWMIDMVREYGTVVPPWYAGQCPLIDEGAAILAPAGPEHLLVAVDCVTGELLWQAPNPRGWSMTHSSIMPAEFYGQKMYIYCGSGGVAGIDAEDGRLLWDSSEWKIRIANVPSPVIIDEQRIFLSGGYNSGSLMMELRRGTDDIYPRTFFKLDPDVFGSAQQTPIYQQGYIYGVRPDEQLVCLDTEGQELWTSSSAHTFGLGPYLIVNDTIYVSDDTGRLTMVRAQSSSFELLDEAQVLEGHDAWGPMAYAAGRLILRDLDTMVCLKIGDNAELSALELLPVSP